MLLTCSTIGNCSLSDVSSGPLGSWLVPCKSCANVLVLTVAAAASLLPDVWGSELGMVC